MIFFLFYSCDGSFALGYVTVALANSAKFNIEPIQLYSFLSLLQGMDVPLFKSAYESPKMDFLLAHSAFCRDVLKLQKGQRAVISNGRVSWTIIRLYLLVHDIVSSSHPASCFFSADHWSTEERGDL